MYHEQFFTSLIDSFEYCFLDEEEVKAQDYQQLFEGYWKSEKAQWVIEHNSDEHANWSGEGRRSSSFDIGFLEGLKVCSSGARCL